MSLSQPGDHIYATDKLAGLAFRCLKRWYALAPACMLPFNQPLKMDSSYAVLLPEDGTFVGVLRGSRFIGPADPPDFQIFFLRPLRD